MIKECLGELFKSRRIKEEEKIKKFTDALEQEEHFTASYLGGEMSLEEYKKALKATSPITRINLRKMASELER